MYKDKISIIVPCYNVEKYIATCLDSIMNQSYKNIEVILVDDGSVDETPKLITNRIKDDKRFNYFYKKNGGLSDARNYGIEKATGKYLCFVDSDDYISDNYIEFLYKSIIDNNVNVSICDIERVYSDHKSINVMNSDKIEMSIHPAAWNKMYLTDIFRRYNIKFLKGKWYEDLGTTTKILFMENYSIVNLPLYKYIQHNNTIMHTYDDRIFDIYEIVNDVEKFAVENNIYNKKYKEIEFINIYHILIGTIYRASFHKKFSINMIKEIYDYVNKKYNNWYKNEYIKKLPLYYQLYLFLLRIKFHFAIYIGLKLFKNKISL